ncbi:hypothetical protein PRIPAC_84546 [Pristionchus pacificus]|uniref:Gamma-glutamyltranspeptidase n=1 Tax=Pristionchus pacificus TaxID=54126 RepID=A0A8R1U5G5_PRIPA|nr:hypothetical protein PRIPAC_84546 [Pristionchus pacificus]|eukprot:PDM78005.1 hypothetical protein PRIPAC_35194 [Pristionchus pacificus]
MPPNEDNLPPAEGPFDEEVPLLPTEEDTKHGKWYVMMISFGLIVIILLLTTVCFAALYFHLNSDNNRIPNWPPPSISPLGKYAKAGVAADNEYCSEIGRNALLQGGNAVDAAIAALFCIGVMDSHSAGIGGGHFMTIYNATTNKCHVIDAREIAPAAADENMYKDKWDESQIGWRAIAVPGELHGLWTEYSKFGSGKVTWKSLVDPTIALMKEGYPTSHALAKALMEKRDIILKEPTMSGFVNPKTGDVYQPGQQIRTRQSFVETLEKVANSSDPIQLFYKGEIAKKVVEEFKVNGGLITLEDMAGYQSIIREDEDVITVSLQGGRHICGPPPPAGAAVAMGILNALDGYKYDMKSFDDIATMYHHFIESSKFAYASRSRLGDSAFVENATEIAKNMTTPEWAKWVRSLITDVTHPDAYYGGTFEAPAVDHGTTHISVIDKFGNAVSVTSTINLLMGSIRASNSTGILWNDEMDDFSLPGHPNYFGFPPSPANFIKPGKRPQSSMSPIVIFDKDDRQQLLSVGGAGGSTIISGVASVALHALWLNANVKQAVDAPRLHNQLQPNVTQYESNFPTDYIDNLIARGHIMEKTDNLTVVTAVERSIDKQIYANSDFRKGDESGPAGY